MEGVVELLQGASLELKITTSYVIPSATHTHTTLINTREGRENI